jgi:RND family efflux transporter MFP subunit
MLEPSSALYELATSYHTCRDVDSLLKTFASTLQSQLGARGVLVWLDENGSGKLRCRTKWFSAGERLEPASESVNKGLLLDMLRERGPKRFRRGELDPRSLVHFDKTYRERVHDALYAPIPGPRKIAGVVEVLNKGDGEFTATDAAFVEEASRITGRALDTMRVAEEERRSQLESFERMTGLYDISRAFNSTLELEELCPIITDKIHDLLGVESCNLWLVAPSGEELVFAHQSGDDPTTNEDDSMALGEGFLGTMAKDGKARLVADAEEEPLLAERRQKVEGFAIATAMAAPLVKDGRVLGVIEAVNKTDGTPFDEDDLFFLTSISDQAALSLNNANLFEAERRLDELHALLTISKEITSTLDLNHILTTVVHQAATVVPFERCAIGLLDHNRFLLGAVSGESEVPHTREMDSLRDALKWVASQPEAFSAEQNDDGWKLGIEEARETFVPFLEAQGYRGFYALPLHDDQGTLGVLALMSSETKFLSENQIETLAILASQVTVAIRNAQLYHQIPLKRVWEPIVETQQRLRATLRGRMTELAAKAGLVVLLLVAVPWKVRVGTYATVVPAERRIVSTEAEGVVRRVLVHEGDPVSAGALLAEIDSSDTRMRLKGVDEKLAESRRQLAEAEFHRDLAAAEKARLQLESQQAEVEFYRTRITQARLVAPFAGTVVTHKIEEKVGRRLAPGEPFCELVDEEHMAAELTVPETDISLLRPGAHTAIKLNTYPTQVFDGRVERLSAQVREAEGEQFFVVRAVFANPSGLARPGMAGRAKISASGGWFESGWYPIGYALLRAPARWTWRKIWTWLP